MANYETYKTIRTIDQYFSTWSTEQLRDLSEKHRQQIYARHVVKSAVFQRDGFKCQNIDCKDTGSKLTLHHIKFKKNNGKDSLKNCVTLCYTCHKAFHRGKCGITINGMTYKIHKKTEINWKKIKAEGKVIRKSHPELKRIEISWELMILLMRFLQIPYDEFDDDFEQASLA